MFGFFNSIMFPNIFALAIKGLGPMTSKGSGLIMTAVVGGAVIPPLIGAAADRVGIQHSFFIPIFAISSSPITDCGDPNPGTSFRRRRAGFYLEALRLHGWRAFCIPGRNPEAPIDWLTSFRATC